MAPWRPRWPARSEAENIALITLDKPGKLEQNQTRTKGRGVAAGECSEPDSGDVSQSREGRQVRRTESGKTGIDPEKFTAKDRKERESRRDAYTTLPEAGKRVSEPADSVHAAGRQRWPARSAKR